MRQQIAETACAMTVAYAQPSTPIPAKRINTTSSTTLIPAEIIRKYNGDLESPRARKNAAKVLYAAVTRSPA